MELKAILFDLGDTLILTDHWDYDKCLINMLKSLQEENLLTSTRYEDFKPVYFKIRNQMYAESEPTLSEVDFSHRIAMTLREFNCNLDKSNPILTRAIDTFFDAFIEGIRIEDDTPALLTRLSEKFRLAVVSNFAHAQGFRRVIQHFNLPNFFNSLVVSAEVGFRKPHPRIFEIPLELLDVSAMEAIFVGDSLKADIFGARMAGIKTIYIENVGLRKNPYAIAGELDPFPIEPDMRIQSLRELPTILEEFGFNLQV